MKIYDVDDYKYLHEEKECENFCFTSDEEEQDAITAGVRVYCLEPNDYYLNGYWDMPHDETGLGDNVLIRLEGENVGKLPPEVMQEIQSILCLGLDNMSEQDIPVSDDEYNYVMGLYKPEKTQP
jgi:hypothetical protein